MTVSGGWTSEAARRSGAPIPGRDPSSQVQGGSKRRKRQRLGRKGLRPSASSARKAGRSPSPISAQGPSGTYAKLNPAGRASARTRELEGRGSVLDFEAEGAPSELRLEVAPEIGLEGRGGVVRPSGGPLPDSEAHGSRRSAISRPRPRAPSPARMACPRRGAGMNRSSRSRPGPRWARKRMRRRPVPARAPRARARTVPRD